MISDDDLLGGVEEPIPDSPPREKILAMRNAAVGRCFVEANQLLLPVTRNFLADAFQMDQMTVRKRLLRCPTVGRAGDGANNKRDLYDFKTAVAYLIPPKMDVEQYIKSLDAAKMPNHINKMFWEALNQRLRYMIAAGDAWSTEDVLEVLGTVGMTVKSRLQLWTETMRERGQMTDAQTVLMSRLVEELQNDLSNDLMKIVRTGETVPIAEKPIGDTVGEVG